MKLLELVMIVKNSGEVLRDCLRINKKYIDQWTILDTGSTDNTIEIIKEELKDIPGNLYQEPFIDFATSRNRSLELSKKNCKYTIILDDSYYIHGGEELLKLLKKSKKESFSIKIGDYKNFLKDSYYSIRIILTEKKLRYKYRVHELINSYNNIYINNDNIFICDIKTGEHKNRTFKRYKNDIKLLLLDYKDYPDDPRIIYYLAKTYYNLENYTKSLEYYSELNKLKNIHIDYQYSSLYEYACTKFSIDNDIEEFKKRLVYLYNNYEKRCEAPYKLAVLYKNEGDINKVDNIISKIISYPKIYDSPTIIQNNIIEYLIPYLYIEVKIIKKEYNIAVKVLKKLLELYPNNQPLLNIKYNLCDTKNIDSIKLSNNKTIVIHTGDENDNIIMFWNPKGDKRISGTEYMVMNIAKELLKFNYRVIIFGTFEDKNNNIDNQTIYQGIEYIDYKYFAEFAMKYVIDIFIVSRFTSKMIYYDNIKSVYLWVHDVLPILDIETSDCIQLHTEKFKKIICVSEWQKENIIKKLTLPESLFFLSRNGIYIQRFLNKNIEKIPFRFIYSSSPDRGLKYLIDIIPKIKERYSETTLELFINTKFLDNDTHEKIKKLDYVHLNNRISQEQLAIEFLKSDIWLYPTDFQETYCITALEAMCAKCLIATVDYCGLGNIIQGKGVICKSPIDENLNELLEKLFFVLDNKNLKNHFVEKAYNWAIEQTIENLAKEWINNIF
jgi:hypothetical protein